VRAIDADYARRLRVRELAAAAHLSTSHFTRLFASLTGRTPRDYIHHVRIEQAKTLLATTAMPIARVADATGFGNHPYFCSSFRAATGMSPRAYRRAARSGQAAASVMSP
jgi:AraC family transcriptional regulator of adaptative response / methylphosphotriester-DNA alkyltransferase methyltransferase